MTEIMTTHDVLKTLTPHEREVLRERFGISEKKTTPESTPSTGSDENGGPGGVPAPAKPPS